MKSATVSDIKKELQIYAPAQLLELCLRLIKYKKDNKELLNYLLFEANDEDAYIKNIKVEIDEQFTLIHSHNLYFAKKSLRKILRTTNKYIKYSGSKQTEAELLIYFCDKLKTSSIAIEKSITLLNLYQAQIKKITKAINGLHEDLQYDYLKELNKLNV
jgi:hypothetical protein